MGYGFRSIAIKSTTLSPPIWEIMNGANHDMRQMTATELNQRLQQGEPLPLLLDVREPHEFQYCLIPGSINIPMHQVPTMFAELDAQRETVVICHHGMRSAQVAHFLSGKGFNVVNLTGGVAAWAGQVDPSMPTY